ncbi:protein MEI2-like 2-like, partial [Trifolium medium]|nr:protein MEI2-like 2-like [Trifolium medium]
AFNGKNWDKLKSERGASLAYARVQGKEALIMEYVMKNLDLETVDMHFRPTLFLSESQYQEESVRYRNLNIRIHQPERRSSDDMVESLKENSDDMQENN